MRVVSRDGLRRRHSAMFWCQVRCSQTYTQRTFNHHQRSPGKHVARALTLGSVHTTRLHGPCSRGSDHGCYFRDPCLRAVLETRVIPGVLRVENYDVIISNGPSRRPMFMDAHDTRAHGPCWRAVNTGSVYRAPVYTGRVGKKQDFRELISANTIRGHGCSVHATRFHGPCRRAMFTCVLDTRVHGPWTQPVSTGSLYRALLDCQYSDRLLHQLGQLHSAPLWLARNASRFDCRNIRGLGWISSLNGPQDRGVLTNILCRCSQTWEHTADCCR